MITQEFENRIKSKRLTQVEQVVAESILHNFHTVGFMTTTDIANELNISDASVFRTARSLGYNGFEELKTEIKNLVSKQLQAANSLREYSQLAPIERFQSNWDSLFENDAIEKLTNNAIASIYDVIDRNSKNNINSCLDILLNSRNKYVCGFRSTAFVANFLAFELLFLLNNVILNTHADGKAIERLADITSEDCVILLVYPRYSNINYIVKQIALDVGAKIILVIDKISHELVKDVDFVFACNPRSISYYNTIIPMVFICEIIISELSKVIPDAFRKRSEFICKYMDAVGLY